MTIEKDGLSPSDLAQWMKSQQDTLNELNKIIRQHIAAMPDINLTDWLRGLKAAFERLRAHLQKHFEAKQEDGYLAMVVEERPTLSGQVDQLRREHDEILVMADRILQDMSEVSPENRLLLGDVCARVQRFMAVVADHDQREVMITVYVFSQDIGTH